MVDREMIEKLIGKQQRIFERNFQNYQASGERRYERAYENAEDLIDVFRVALNAADEHLAYINLKANIAMLGGRAVSALHHDLNDLDEVRRVLRELKAISGANDPWKD